MPRPEPPRTDSPRTPSSFPVHLTRLVGRQREITAVRELLATTRLLTITGAGGSGKTRLALEVARQDGEHRGGEHREGEHRGGGTTWVELAPVLDPSQLGNHVAAALGVRDEGARPMQETIAASLGDRDMLLVLDNCEHLVVAVAGFVDALLRRCPGLRVLATSREALGIGGERAWLVPVLSLPPTADITDTECVAESEAVQLFVQRAQDVLPSFTLTDGNAAAVAAICRRVDGLPLAIELAAARVKVLAPEQIAARLDDAFRVLGSGPRTALPRHRTLREAIGWSVRLLDESEARLLSRLSVFAGDFPLDAVESICNDALLPDDEILETLSALVDKSLVAMREVAGGARYALLETIRQYAAELLSANGEEATWRARHAGVYTSLVSALEPRFITRERAAAVATLSLDLDNVRAALVWSRTHDAALHLRLAGMLTWFWYSLGLWSEARRWLEGALALPVAAAPARERAAALFGAGAVAALQADSATARGWLEESRDIAGRVGDPGLAAYASNYLGMAYAGAGLLDGDSHSLAALEWFQRHGDLYGHRLALLILATVYLGRGDVEKAERAAADAVDVARRFGVDRELGIALQVLGTIRLHRGDPDAAEAKLLEALERLRRDPQPLFMARAVDVLALIALRRGDVLLAARFFGAAAGERELIGASLFSLDRDRLAPHVAAAKKAAGELAFKAAWEEGRGQRLAETINELLAAPRATIAEEVAKPEPVNEVERPPVAPPVATAAAVAPEAPATVAERRLEVQAFGRLRIRCDGKELGADAWRSAKPRELLVYLLLNPEGRTREQIGITFWPDASAAGTKNNFHVALHGIRRALGAGDWVVYEGDRYRINPALRVDFDAVQFETRVAALTHGLKRQARGSFSRTAAASGNGAGGNVSLDETALRELQDALDLYQGDLLADEGAADWHLEYRDALRRLYSDTLQLAGDAFTHAGNHECAAEMFRRLVRAEPLDEAGYRGLMQSLAQAGARTEALRQYDRLASLLETELDARPARDTTAVRDRIARGEPTVASR